jgi:hypothetical protein
MEWTESINILSSTSPVFGRARCSRIFVGQATPKSSGLPEANPHHIGHWLRCNSEFVIGEVSYPGKIVAEIVSVSCEPMNDTNRFGGVNSATLALRCPISTWSVQADPLLLLPVAKHERDAL